MARIQYVGVSGEDDRLLWDNEGSSANGGPLFDCNRAMMMLRSMLKIPGDWETILVHKTHSIKNIRYMKLS